MYQNEDNQEKILDLKVGYGYYHAGAPPLATCTCALERGAT